MQRNFVAKHAHINRASVQKDRKAAQKRGDRKHRFAKTVTE